MLDLLLILAGVAAGFVLGLLPGFHINNLLPFLPALFFSTPFAGFVTAASVSFVFSSFYPTVLLGVPSEDTSLGVLPAHRLASQGQAYTALLLFAYGGLFAVIFSILVAGFFTVFAQPLYGLAKPVIPGLLLVIVFFLAVKSRASLTIVFLSSVLGFLTFDYDLLFPLLSGFFAASTLVTTLFSKHGPVVQETVFRTSASKFSLSLAGATAALSASFFSMLPGVSSAVSASAAQFFTRMKDNEFLFSLGVTSMAYMLFSFYTFSLLGLTRSGSAAFLSSQPQADFLFYAGSILAAGGMSALLCLKLARPAVTAYAKINKRVLEAAALAFLIFSNLFFTGLYGLLVFSTATLIGLSSTLLRVQKATCMTALITPTIVVLL